MQENVIRKPAKRFDLSYFHTKQWRRFKSKYLTLSFLAKVLGNIVRAVIIIGLCFLILYPFFVKIVNGLKPVSEMTDPTVRFIPKRPTLANFATVIGLINYKTALLNSLWFTTILAAIQTIVSALVGYGFARYKFRGNGPLFFLVIFTLIVPPETIMIPFFMKFRFFLGFIDLLNTGWPFVILATCCLGLKNGLYIFMFRQYYRNMPKELEEASYLDGCNSFQTFYKIMLPPAVSMIVTIFLLAFSWQWTDTTYTSMFINDPSRFVLICNAVNLPQTTSIAADLTANYQQIASILGILPVAIIYIFAQRFFVQSIDRTGLVG